MKKVSLLLILLCLLPASLSAREIVRLTRYEGERIIGVSASNAFRVELIQSEQTKAVVEIDALWEPYLRFSLDSNGIVTVGRRSLSRQEQREFDRLFQQYREGPTMKLTLYLPRICGITLSGASRLTASEPFEGDNASIRLSGSSRLEGLDLSGTGLKLECSSASKASLTYHAGGELAVAASGSARVELTASGVTASKLTVSSASGVTLKGDFGVGEWNTSGSGRIAGEESSLGGLTLTASSASRVLANVSTGDLAVTASGSARVELTANGVPHSKVVASSAASVLIKGSGDRGDWIGSGSARITAEDFALRELTVDASGGSAVRANVSESLTTRTSGSGTVRYRGNPRIQNTNNAVRPLE
jgi:hypothetical protein